VQNLAGAPASPVKGQMYFNSTGGDNTLYWFDGTSWIPAKSGASLALASSASALVVGGAASGGSASDVSRGDHVHSLPGWGVSVAETTFGGAKADGSAVTFARSDHKHGTPLHDAAAHSAISLSALAAPTTALNMNGQLITSLGAPASGSDAVNKTYVDNIAQGLSAHPSARLISVSHITLSGVGQFIDGYAVAAGDRILAKQQSTSQANGVYVAAAGAWTRALDFDAWSEFVSAYIWIEQGDVYGDTGWVCTSDAGGTLGTSGIAFVQFSSASMISAGQGLIKTGDIIDVMAGDSTLTVSSNSMVVNTSVIATRAYADAAVPPGVTKKYAAALTGTTSPEVVTHSLGTRDIHLQVLNSAYTAVDVDCYATSTTTATVRFSPALGAGCRVVVVG